MEAGTNSTPLEAPRGTYPARVDEKGRLKLPVKFHEYLKSFGQTEVFVTSLDGRIAQIYPISIWRQNELLFDQAGEDSEVSESVNFLVSHWGADAELDGQGRVLVPPELRRALGIEGEQVMVNTFRGRINIYSQSVYDEMLAAAQERASEKVRLLQTKGLK
ncbi:MAG: hypothetical protein FJW40_04605 [Acidobacteria bacterium]|nr:hypothetical protein [Acidobacteriota bacterium]